jgi:hypothetical protein
MQRPDWVSEPAWVLLEPVLARAPAARASDALDDLQNATRGWDAPARASLIARFAHRAQAGAPFPVAVILALSDLLGAPRHE